MCGRYNIDFEANRELTKLLKKLNKQYPGSGLKSGEVFPKDRAAVYLAYQEKIVSTVLMWGYPQYTGKGLIINARSETAAEKTMFREGMQSHRCIIPTTGFYEWNEKKQKFLFERRDQDILYLAGLYHVYQDIPRFVILTTKANASMEDVHHRMPVILESDQCSRWIQDEQAAREIVQQTPTLLEKQLIS